MNATTATTPATGGKRRGLLIGFTLLLIVVLAGYGVWWLIYLRHYETTDDAYVAGNLVQVTSQVGGTVTGINADDTDLVQSGTPLIELDHADAKVALDQAEAQLAQTVREVRTYYVNNATLEANVKVKSDDVERAASDLKRRQELAGTGAVSKEEIEHAKTALQSAQSALEASREQLNSNRVLTDHTSVANHPNVQRAATLVQAAYLAYSRATLPAPITGYVARRSVQVGQRIAPGAPLLSIVPLNALWVEGNFKEVQLAHMRIGQPVTLRSDIYGSDVTFHGKVQGLAAGTGAAFALLPSQNASGNWIKIVQRVPVRIALDPGELAAHPLRIGLSMQIKVDVANDAGTSLTQNAPARSTPAYETKVFDQADREAAAVIARIVAENSGKSDAGKAEAK